MFKYLSILLAAFFLYPSFSFPTNALEENSTQANNSIKESSKKNKKVKEYSELNSTISKTFKELQKVKIMFYFTSSNEDCQICE